MSPRGVCAQSAAVLFTKPSPSALTLSPRPQPSPSALALSPHPQPSPSALTLTLTLALALAPTLTLYPNPHLSPFTPHTSPSAPLTSHLSPLTVHRSLLTLTLTPTAQSGAVFYLTDDGRFLIKTVSRKESKFLREILPNYYNHVMSSDNTLLPRFYGLIRITTASHRRIRLAIFNNLLPLEVPIQEKFDLKGSTLGRYATEAERRDPNVTLKDLDFHQTLLLSKRHLNLIHSQLDADIAWLRSLHIMDYSMLLLLHFPSRYVRRW